MPIEVVQKRQESTKEFISSSSAEGFLLGNVPTSLGCNLKAFFLEPEWHVEETGNGGTKMAAMDGLVPCLR